MQAVAYYGARTVYVNRELWKRKLTERTNKKILPSSIEVRFSRVQNNIVRLFWAENQGNRQNFEKTDTSYEM